MNSSVVLSRHEFAFALTFSSYSVPTLIWIVNEALVAELMLEVLFSEALCVSHSEKEREVGAGQ